MELLNKILGHDCKESMAVTLFLKGFSEVCTRCPWSALGILNSHVSALNLCLCYTGPQLHSLFIFTESNLNFGA